MKKIKRRAYSALLIAALIVAGIGVYLVRLVRDGEDWATFQANRSVYNQGVLNTGTVYDRNGKILAKAGDGVFSYSEDWASRVSCLHVVGDYAGNIGSGALSAFASQLVDYSLLGGTESGGGEVRLTIDAELNATAYGALNGRNGAVCVFNYETGEILCMVSAPSYDPNGAAPEGVEGIYLNRVLGAAYTPGSVFKIITLAAAIENIADLYTRSFYCGGSVTVDGSVVKCTGTHGSQTIEDAFANSCNCAFAELSLELGGETLLKYAGDYGVLSSHDLNGISTIAGSFEAAADGSTALAWSGIGQSTDLVSPFAMLRVVGAVAGGGTLVEPKILIEDSLFSSKKETVLIRPDTAARLDEMLSFTVAKYGEWSFPGLDIRAKTGTAEVGDGTSHAWLTGYLSSGEPLAFVVVIEHGGGGLSAAAPVANTVLQAALAD